MTDIMTMISTLGFPITACVAMGLYVKYIGDLFLKELDKLNNTLDKNTIQLAKILAKIGEDIEDNEKGI